MPAFLNQVNQLNNLEAIKNRILRDNTHKTIVYDCYATNDRVIELIDALERNLGVIPQPKPQNPPRFQSLYA